MTFFLTGGSGTLGTELQYLLDCQAPRSKDCNITDPAALRRPEYYGDVEGVIHCAAYTDVPGAESNRAEAIEANVIGTKNIADRFTKERIVYISTDYVYPGITGGYKETDETSPFNFYAMTKLMGEAFMKPDKDLIIRTSFKPKGTWEYPKAFVDLWTSSDYVDVIARELALVIDSDLTGIINVGTERKSIYELASRRTVEVGTALVDSVSGVKMPKDISMDLTKFKKYKVKKTGGYNG